MATEDDHTTTSKVGDSTIPEDTENTIPISNKVEILHIGAVQYANSTGSFTNYLRGLVPKNEDISVNYLGLGFIKILKVVKPSIAFRLLVSARELPVVEQENGDTKINGQFVIKMASPGNLSNEAQLNILQECAHLAINSKAHHEATFEGLPKYISAFNYSLPPVNFSDHMPCAVLYGMQLSWLDVKDYKAKDRLLDEIINCLPMDENKTLPPMLADGVKLRHNIGLSHYSSSKARIDGKHGQMIALLPQIK